jgi:hypothetical protein
VKEITSAATTMLDFLSILELQHGVSIPELKHQSCMKPPSNHNHPRGRVSSLKLIPVDQNGDEDDDDDMKMDEEEDD